MPETSYGSDEPTILTLDLGTNTGWNIRYPKYDEETTKLHKKWGAWWTSSESGVEKFSTKRIEGAGMRFLRFWQWLDGMYRDFDGIDEVYFEEVVAHKGGKDAHAYGGYKATLTAWCEKNMIPYQGVPVGTIKKYITGKGNANKQMVIDAVNARGYQINDDNEADAIALMLYIRERKK